MIKFRNTLFETFAEAAVDAVESFLNTAGSRDPSLFLELLSNPAEEIVDEMLLVGWLDGTPLANRHADLVAAVYNLRTLVQFEVPCAPVPESVERGTVCGNLEMVRGYASWGRVGYEMVEVDGCMREVRSFWYSQPCALHVDAVTDWGTQESHSGTAVASYRTEGSTLWYGAALGRSWICSFGDNIGKYLECVTRVDPIIPRDEFHVCADELSRELPCAEGEPWFPHVTNQDAPYPEYRRVHLEIECEGNDPEDTYDRGYEHEDYSLNCEYDGWPYQDCLLPEGKVADWFVRSIPF